MFASGGGGGAAAGQIAESCTGGEGSVFQPLLVPRLDLSGFQHFLGGVGIFLLTKIPVFWSTGIPEFADVLGMKTHAHTHVNMCAGVYINFYTYSVYIYIYLHTSMYIYIYIFACTYTVFPENKSYS
jgi:hypothetical protein